jgi:hypothetical protein
MTYRGATALVIAWLACFGFVVAAAAIIGGIHRLTAPRHGAFASNTVVPQPQRSPPSNATVAAPPAAPANPPNNRTGHSQ